MAGQLWRASFILGASEAFLQFSQRELDQSWAPVRAGSDEAVTERAPVTVVVPCFNEGIILPYLANTLKSVEAFLAPRYELNFILVDDGSTDSTWATLREFRATDPAMRSSDMPRTSAWLQRS